MDAQVHEVCWLCEKVPATPACGLPHADVSCSAVLAQCHAKHTRQCQVRIALQGSVACVACLLAYVLPAPLCCGGWWPAAVVANLWWCRPVSQQECAELVIMAVLCLCLVHSSAVGAVQCTVLTGRLVPCSTLPHVAACTCSRSGRLHDYLFFLTLWFKAFLVMPASTMWE